MDQRITELLQAASRGEADAENQIWDAVYPRLHKMAIGYFSKERPGGALSSTDLVHEVFLKLNVELKALNTDSRHHFFALASRMMRHVIIDTARSRQVHTKVFNALNENAAVPVPGRNVPADILGPEELMDLERALCQLEERDTVLGKVVECKFYGGLTNRETAEVMGVSERTIERHWLRARTYLMRTMRTAQSNAQEGE